MRIAPIFAGITVLFLFTDQLFAAPGNFSCIPSIDDSEVQYTVFPAFSEGKIGEGLKSKALEKDGENFKYTSVDSFVNNLPRVYSENWLPIFSTASPHSHEVNAEKGRPRIKAFSKSGFIAYTAPEHRSHSSPYPLYEIFEFAQYIENDGSPRIEMGLIHFPGKSFPDLPPRISNGNPVQCMSCHRNPSRILRDTYNGWRDTGTTSRLGAEIFVKGSPLEGYLSAFKQLAPSEPRYAHLEWHDPSSATGAYGDNVLANIESLHPGGTEKVSPVTYGKYPDMSARRDSAAQRMTNLTIAGQFTENVNFSKIKYALLGLAYDCQNDGGFEKFFNDEQRVKHGPFKDYVANFRQGVLEESQKKRQFFSGENSMNPIGDAVLSGNIQQFYPDYSGSVGDDFFAGLFYLAKIGGINPSSFSSTPGGYYSFGTPHSESFRGLQRVFISMFDRAKGPQCTDRSLPTDLPMQSSSLDTTQEIRSKTAELCSKLSSLSQAALATGLQERNLPPIYLVDNRKVGAPKVFAKCLGCHTGNPAINGQLPFETSAQFAAYVHRNPEFISKIETRIKSNLADEKMPRGLERLFPEEIDVIIEYMEQFK